MPYPDSTYEQTWRDARADKPFVLVDVNQHTPGPWFANDDCIEAGGPEGPRDVTIAEVQWQPHRDTRLAADARLIAAAPCLLSALERLMSEIGDGFNCDPSDATLSQCWSAIRKARRGGE